MKKIFILAINIIIFFTTYAQINSSADIAHNEMKYHSKMMNELSNSSTNYDVHFYRCIWNVDPAVRFISGSVTTHFTITSATNNIVFDLSKPMEVDSVLYHGNSISFGHSLYGALQIIFPSTLNVNQKDSVQIFYKGVPADNGFGTFVTSSHNGVPVLWTLSEPYGAREWWPCKDILTDKADSIDIIITYPAAYRSSTNGLPISETTNGTTKTDYWKHRYPIVSYLVAIAVTNYVVDNDAVQLSGKNMPVVMYAYPENELAFKSATNLAKILLQKFSELVGVYPFVDERYAQTQFSWGGGMEHQTNSFIVSPNARLVAHELAHQWFGDKVTCAIWQDLWLNEGFASYFEHLYVEYIEGSSVLANLQNWRNNITSSPGGSVFVDDINNINRLFDFRLTYLKAGYLVHMLRWKMGDEKFFLGLRQYLNDPLISYGSARTADLKRNLESVSGLNLTEFFNDWLYGEGYPNYTAEWSQLVNNHVQVKLNQTTSHPSVDFFEMPVPLYFRNATRDTFLTVNHTTNGQVFNIDPGFMADTMIIDPQLWILSKNKIAIKVDNVSVPEDFIVFPNPVVNNNLNLFIPASLSQQIELRIFNYVGQLMYSSTRTTAGNEQINIPVQTWASGIYLLQINSGGRKIVKKVMIVK